MSGGRGAPDAMAAANSPRADMEAVEADRISCNGAAKGVVAGVVAAAAAAKAQKETQAANRAKALKQAMQAKKLLNETSAPSSSNGASSPPPASPSPDGPAAVSEKGVSLHWLVNFADCLSKAGLPEDASTGCMVSRYLQPLMRGSSGKSGCLWDCIPAQHQGKPEYYIVHAWQADFANMIRAVSDKLDPPALPNQPPPPPVDTQKIFVWIDFAAIAQNPGVGQSVLEAGAVRETLGSCRGGSLVVLDSELVVLRRAWCLLEIFLTVYLLQPDKLHVLFPEDMEIDMGIIMHNACSSTDLVKAETSRPEDKLQIVREVKHTVGMQKMQQLVADGMTRAVRVSLRWSTLEHTCLYCALLINKGELGLLYLVLSLIPELKVEDMMLEEILTLFKMYDTDGSGELDQDEFVNALGAAGISEAEAIDMYVKCNADGGDGVSIEEFEKWWIDNQAGGGGQDTAADSGVSPEGYTMDQLVKLIDGFGKLLQRMGLEQHVPYFVERAKELQGTSSSRLAMPATRGDWKTTIGKMNWKLTHDDCKGAAQLLYAFLLNNAELLSTDIKDVPVFEASASLAEQYKSIHTYVDMLVAILLWYPGRKREAKMLKELARKYRVLMMNASEAEAENRLPSIRLSKNVKKDRWQKGDKFIFNIITRMVHLKYGDNHTMGQKVIKSALRALSRWMAKTRKSETMSDYEAISQFSADYLASLDTESEPAYGNSQAQGNIASGSALGSHYGACDDGSLWDWGGLDGAIKGSSSSMIGSPIVRGYNSSSLPPEPFLPSLSKGSGSPRSSPVALPSIPGFDGGKAASRRQLLHANSSEHLRSSTKATSPPQFSRVLAHTNSSPLKGLSSELTKSASTSSLDTGFTLINKPAQRRSRYGTVI